MPVAQTKGLETFSRKLTATAGHLINPQTDQNLSQHYQDAMSSVHRELRNPLIQRHVFALSQTTPRDFFRSKLSAAEIQHRALTYLPEDILRNLPENSNPFSLFQGFQATLPESSQDHRHRRKRHGRHQSKSQQLLEEKASDPNSPAPMKNLRNEKHSLDHRLEMLDVRKNMCSTEIKEIDNKIANLNSMRQIILDRLASLEQEEADLEGDILEVETKIEDLQEELEDEAALRGTIPKTPTNDEEQEATAAGRQSGIQTPDAEIDGETSFMSESIYSKLPSSAQSKTKRPRPGRRRTNFILHEHLSAGSEIRQIRAHEDQISALDFDAPFGTMVTAALDDTVRVWDLNRGRCIGLLEGHLSSVRCLQVEENFVATGSMDATVRLWDLNQAEYAVPPSEKRINKRHAKSIVDEDGNPRTPRSSDDEEDFASAPNSPPPSNMRDCATHTLSAHVAEITALHFHNNGLITGSADKTLRQWDLEKGRCIQTLDVLWAAAQASATHGSSMSTAGLRSRAAGADSEADFVGAVQCFDAALACGTADGMVRLWDLRSGMVHRSLVGHTGPVTCLQFDETHLVTGSADRSIRIWDLRTGGIFDAYAYDEPITSMSFDSKSIAAAAGESVVKVYDKAEARHWDCGISAGDDHSSSNASTVDRVRLRDGYLIAGQRDGKVSVAQFAAGERDYTLIKGDTGPLVYPAGHVYAYKFLYDITDEGRNILLAQCIFGVIYIFNEAMAMWCYYEANSPPYLLPLLILSKRLHSIYLLRCFNDSLVTTGLFLAILLLQKRRYTAASIAFSLGLSVKMSLLLALPAIGLILFQAVGPTQAVLNLSYMGQVQLILAVPFLQRNIWGYLSRAFDLGRVFEYKWTVNWRFVSEETFLSREFAGSLLAAHLSLLVLFVVTRWSQPARRGSFVDFVKMTFVAPPQEERDAMAGRVTPDFVLTSTLTAMAIGMLCARSLHYQFFAWLAWATPWLLYKSELPPLVLVAVWFGQEMAWNVYPSTVVSSRIVVGVLAAIVVRVWVGTDEVGEERGRETARRAAKLEGSGLRGLKGSRREKDVVAESQQR
ncbi:MAG: hypothetical protein Q9159_001223 [Coniocarpon cinnabarinum]